MEVQLDRRDEREGRRVRTECAAANCPVALVRTLQLRANVPQTQRGPVHSRRIPQQSVARRDGPEGELYGRVSVRSHVLQAAVEARGAELVERALCRPLRELLATLHRLALLATSTSREDQRPIRLL